ncbi:hypothetical protein [Clostridium sp. C2-6-12]|nr:hypothetical protein [Clostridium sp. C2-6-12]
MFVEIILTAVLVLYTAHILYSKFIKGTSGGCCCNNGSKSKKKCSK